MLNATPAPLTAPFFCPQRHLPVSLAAVAGMHVVIWGVGSHGGALADALVLHQHGAKISLLDSVGADALPTAAACARTHGWTWHHGDATLAICADADLILVSPAIPPRALPSDASLRTKMCSSLMLFFHWRAQAHSTGRCAAITGTKGKSSTARACAAFLDWHCAGNSHGSVLQLLHTHGAHADVVLELSSFQLWYLQHSDMPLNCTTALITNIDQDHLDWHSNLAEYQAAKRWLGSQAAYTVDANTVPPGTYASYMQPTTPPHSQRNLSQAIHLALHEGADQHTIRQQIPQLTPLPHRQCLAHRCTSTAFINDSAATCPQATLAAIEAFLPQYHTCVFIIGGHHKGADLQPLAACIQQHRISCVLLGAAAADLVHANIHGPICETLEAAMETAVTMLGGIEASAESSTGMKSDSAVILSPACASAGMFRDCAQRGERFTQCAQQRWPSDWTPHPEQEQEP